jgi:DNA-binding NarL/FixJ family response regulator
MPTRQVIVANEQRLLRDMLIRVIEKTPDFRAIVLNSGLTQLPELLERTEAQWVIVSLRPDGEIPEYVEQLLNEHPMTRFLAMAADGSELKMKWVVPHEQELENLSLNGLIEALRARAPWEIELQDQKI